MTPAFIRSITLSLYPVLPPTLPPPHQGFDLDALSIDAAGSGTTSFDGQSKMLKLRMAGVGHTIIKAPPAFVADTLEADVFGAGSLDAGAFKAEQVNLNMAGTSDVAVFASKAITVRGAGTGNLVVGGNPEQRNIGLFGTGKVEFKRTRTLMRRAA
jgi:hypothetical protein